MEVHQLEQFKMISECRTMREAAARLYLSQPALSQSLKKLEAELGCPLFDRSHNQLSLTPYGEILLSHTQRILYDLKEVAEKIEARKQQEACIIRIGSFYTPLNLFALPQIANAMPNYNFAVTINSSKALAKSLIDGKLDLAFLPDQFCPAHLASEPFFEESLLLSVTAKSPLAAKTEIEDGDLKETPLLLPSDFPGLSQWYEEALKTAGVSSSLIEKMPVKEYLETMDRTDRAHFSTTMMTMFSGAGSVRPSIPVKSPVSPRTISIAVDPSNERAKPVLNYISEKKEELISNHAFLPYLMYQNASPNLFMKFEL